MNPQLSAAAGWNFGFVSLAEELRVFPVGGGNKEMLGDEKGGLWPI